MKFFILILACIYLVKCQEDHDHDHDDVNIRHLEWWEKAVFYQIYPRSFMDSDGNGEGDLKGITSKLTHLQEMGITATWLSPIMASPMYDSGYDISNFTDINPRFGTMEDFEEMVAKAKELGIKIIMDFVPNHSSTEGKWFLESANRTGPYDDWFVWEDGKVDENGDRIPPNNWVSVFRGSAWEWNEQRGQYYLHQFAVQQPDLNYRNPEVVEEMKNVLRFWVEKGVAGFRVDAINHLFEVDKNDFNGTYPDEERGSASITDPDDYGYLDHTLTKDLYETVEMVFQWRQVLEEFKAKDNETRVMMTEAYTDIKKTMQYYGNSTSEGSHMPFNFGLISDVNAESTAKDLKFIIDRWLTYMPEGKSANWVIGNHDQPRVGTRYGEDRIDSLNMLVLLLPGVGVTYNGEEIGMLNYNDISWEDTEDPQACNTNDTENYWKVSRDPSRTPFQWSNGKNAGFSSSNKTWLPVNPNYIEINLEMQKTQEVSHFNIYKSLMELRSQHVFRHGKFYSIAFDNNVFAFVRWLPGYDYYVIIINMSGDQKTVNLSVFESVGSELTLVEKSQRSGREIGKPYNTEALTLEGYESLVLMGSGASAIFKFSLLLLLPFLTRFFN